MANFNLGQLVWKITADSAQFATGLNTSEKKLKTFSDRAQKIGGTLTKFVTLPLLGAAGVAVKFASDLAESTNAANVVFGESAKIITDWGENAAEQAGLSKTAFNEAATSIGTLLKKSGQDLDTVAGNTIELTKRAADLASVFNTDVSEATVALGAALRGESEPARRFGITLTEAAVQAKALELGLAATKNEISEAAKIQARYALILEESAQVAGDFENTNEGAANSLRVIKAQATDLAADLGSQLLPIVEDVLGVVREWTDRLAELDEEQIKTILQVGAVVAALGPAIALIGKTTAAVNTLKTAFATLGIAGGPVLLALTAVAALTGGVIALTKRQQELKEQRIAEEYEGMAAAAGLTEKQIRRLGDTFVILNADEAAGIQTVIELAEEQAEATGKTIPEVLAIAAEYDGLNDRVREVVRSARQQVAEEERLLRLQQDQVDDIRQIRDLKVQTFEAAKAQADVLRQQEIKNSEILDLLRNIDALNRAGAIDEIQTIERKIEVREVEIDKIIEAAELGRIAAGEARSQIAEQQSSIERYYARLKELDTETSDETSTRRLEEFEEQNRLAEERKLLEAQIDEEIEEGKKARHDAELQRIEAEKQARIAAAQFAYGQLTNIFSQYYANELSSLKTQKESGKITEQEYAKEVAKIQQKQFRLNQATSAIQATISGAGAAVKAFEQLGPIGGAIAAAVIAGLTATQVGLILSQDPPPIPQFQFGGVVPGDPSKIDGTLAALTPGEEVITAADPRHVNNGGVKSGPFVFVFEMDGRMVGQNTVDRINNGEYRIKMRLK